MDNSLYWILDGKRAVPCPDRDLFFQWAAENDITNPEHRRVGRYDYQRHGKHIMVSTVFLAINHGHFGVPLLFETMVQINNEEWADYQVRYETWGEAQAGHKEAVAWARHEILGLRGQRHDI